MFSLSDPGLTPWAMLAPVGAKNVRPRRLDPTDKTTTKGISVKPLPDVQQETLTGVFRLVVPETVLVGTACVAVPARAVRAASLTGCGARLGSGWPARRSRPRCRVGRKSSPSGNGRGDTVRPPVGGPVRPGPAGRVRPLGGPRLRGRVPVRWPGRRYATTTPPSTTPACSSSPPACRWSAGRTTWSRCSWPWNWSPSRPTSCSTCRPHAARPGGGGQVLPAERPVVGGAAVRVQLPVRPDRADEPHGDRRTL